MSLQHSYLCFKLLNCKSKLLLCLCVAQLVHTSADNFDVFKVAFVCSQVFSLTLNGHGVMGCTL